MYKRVNFTIPESMGTFIKVATGNIRASGQRTSASALVTTCILEAMEARLESQPWISGHLTRVRDELTTKRRRGQLE